MYGEISQVHCPTTPMFKKNLDFSLVSKTSCLILINART
jgi:hypothetical protein